MMCLSVEEWKRNILFLSVLPVLQCPKSVDEKVNQHQYESGDAKYPGEKILTHGLLLVQE
jgi:hypothetical protein